MADVVALAVEELKKRGAEDAAALATRAVSGEADGTELIEKEEVVPTWRQRDYSSVPVGTPYKWQEQVYKLWQQHDASQAGDWSPDKAVSLWDICHTTDPDRAKEYVAPQGSRGMYQTGECCLYGGQVYRSIIDSNSWAPDAYPQGWEMVSGAETQKVSDG